MKIIGTGHDGHYIVDINEDELSNLVGYHSNYARKNDHCGSSIYQGPMIPFNIGTEIKVSGMYRQLYDLSNNQKTLKQTAETLRTVANLLELQNPVVEALTEDKEKKA
jgi:hypothetical protein